MVKVYTGMLPSGYANADLKWETSEQTDLGIDLRFFNSALTFSADYFVKKTRTCCFPCRFLFIPVMAV